MASGFKINKKAIKDMTREIEREFAKNPVRVPLEADPANGLTPATTINNYNGPVVTVSGNHSQVSWGNDVSVQTQSQTQEIAPGFEQLATMVTDFLANIQVFPFDEQEASDARDAAQTVLAEVVKTEPDKAAVRKSATLLKGLLAPFAAGLSKAVSEESADAARSLIESISSALPS